MKFLASATPPHPTHAMCIQLYLECSLDAVQCPTLSQDFRIPPALLLSSCYTIALTMADTEDFETLRLESGIETLVEDFEPQLAPVYDPMTESNSLRGESDAEAENETYVPEPQPPTTPIKSLGCEC